MKRIHVLVEGQTEETFIRDVVAEHLWPFGLSVSATLAATKRVKSGGKFKGGVTSYQRVEFDVRKLLGDSSAALVTTMLDFYRLPRDFPGWKTVPAGPGAARAAHLERAFERKVGDPRFLAYFSVHEFEALLFADLTACAEALGRPAMGLELQRQRVQFATPEDINEGEETAPSRRILKVFPGFQKPLHGPLAVMQIGLQQLRRECPRFERWIARLEAVGSAQAQS